MSRVELHRSRLIEWIEALRDHMDYPPIYSPGLVVDMVVDRCHHLIDIMLLNMMGINNNEWTEAGANGDILRHARTQTVTTVFLRISPKYKQS